MAEILVGKRIPKIEGRGIVTGQYDFVDENSLPGMLFGALLVSPHPHAKILHVDVTKAERVSGVKGIITGKDLPNRRYGRFIQDERPLAKKKVRYVGDPVAAVAADDISAAKEAVSMISVEYDTLPAVFDPLEALEPGAPKIHDGENNICDSGRILAGNVEVGFQEADIIFEDFYETSRVTHCCLQARATLASFEAGKLTLWPGTQVPYVVRNRMATFFDLPLHRVRVIQMPQGGAFGERGELSPLDYCTSALAMKTGRPVKMVFSREEEFENTRPRIKEIIRVKTGVKKDGTMVARQMDVTGDGGAYAGSSPGNVWWGGLMQGALYRISHMECTWRVVYTNLVPTGSMRGFGNPQTTFAGESQIDRMAQTLDMDPMAFRLRNAVHVHDTTPFGMELKSCALTRCIEEAADKIGWRRKRPPKAGKKRGLGMACQVHCSGARYSAVINADYSSARIKFNDDGTVNLTLGINDLGQGANTIMAQIAAEELGLKMEAVEVSSGDTEIGPQDMAVGATRFTVLCGNAVKEAAKKLKKRLFEVAAEKLEANVRDLDVRDGAVFVKGSPSMRIPVSDVVREGTYRKDARPFAEEAYYDGKGRQPNPETGCGDISTSYPYACQTAEVEVDIETGEVRILRFVSAHDIGRVINPMLAEGQVEGGVHMGIGYALTEDLIYQDGKLINGNFLDYKILRAPDMPLVESIFVEEEDPRGPYGAKGLSEPCVIPTAGAIANAIYDAIGVQCKSLPITPEKILDALSGEQSTQRHRPKDM